jgi:hypothetical protein
MKRLRCWLFGHRYHLARATMLRFGDWRLTYKCVCGAEKLEVVESLVGTLMAKFGIREEDL